MAGYQRQSASAIQPNEPVTASAFNNEYNALATAFNSSGGHSHSGAVGEGAKIDYNNLLNKPTIVTLTSSAPAALGASASVGVATTAARADHVHARPSPADIGAATSAHTHSNVTTSTAGFMSAADKIKLNGIADNAATGTVSSLTAGTGITLSSPTITTSGTISVNTSVVAVKNASNDFANNLQLNPVLQGEGYVSINKGTATTSLTCDLSTGSFFRINVTSSSGSTVTFTNAKSGRAHVVYLEVNFSTAAPFAITGDKMRGSPAPMTPNSTSANSQSWATSGTDILQCITFDGGTNWYVIRLATNPT